MNEVGFKSISSAGFNQDNITKQFNASYSTLPDTTFPSSNNYKMSNIETKEIINLKKTVNRLEKNISFIQQEHIQLLKDLQKQVEQLRGENQELQFQLVMRSSRTIENDFNTQLNIQKPVLQNTKEIISESASLEIIKLKQALQEEKNINNELIQKLNSITLEMEEVKHVIPDNKKRSHFTSQDFLINHNNMDGEINISSNIRISLDPLTMSLFHEDSGKYIINTSPSLEDCQVIIKTLLEKPQFNLSNRNSESSLRSLSAQRTPLIPYIKRPLQNIKPLPQSSISNKFNTLRGSLSSKPMGLTSNHPKLSPIVSHKNDVSKLEKESNLIDISRNTERGQKQGSAPSLSPDNKLGCSLPALPKPTDYNQAEKHRRLHLLQKKRLDNYNNRL